MKNFKTAALKLTISSIALFAFFTANQGIARADEVQIAGSATGTFAATGNSTLLGINYSGSTFNDMTVGNFLGLGGNPNPGSNFNNLGSIMVSSAPNSYTGNAFTLRVTFTAPAGITGGNPATFSANLLGTISGTGSGGVFFDFNNTPINFTFANANATGSFSFQVNDITINGGQTGAISANIIGSQTPAAIPEPATMALLGIGLAGIAARLRQCRPAK